MCLVINNNPPPHLLHNLNPKMCEFPSQVYACFLLKTETTVFFGISDI